MPDVLLLGGGHAHVQVLADLARAPWPGVRITLVSPQAAPFYSGMVPGCVAGHYLPSQCRLDVAGMAARGRVTFIGGEAIGIAADDRRVRLRTADGLEVEAAYDLVSVDVGGVAARTAIPGAAAHALFVRPLEAFVEGLEPWLARRGAEGGVVAVVGGGAAAFEIALALRFRLPAASTVHLVAGADGVLPGYPRGTRARAMRMLQSRRIVVHARPCSAVEADAVSLASGERLACELCIVASASEAPSWLAGSGLALAAGGFVAIGATLQSVSHAEVFAVGDVAALTAAPYPRSGVHAVRSGAVLARNLRRFIAGEALLAYRPPARTLNLLSCGPQYAIASWGRWSAEGAWLWQLKDRIDRRFVASVCGPTNSRPLDPGGW